jgi:uncharacterized cupin superfamily protein
MRKPADENAPALLTADTIAGLAELAYRHPLNTRAVRHGRSLGDATGLTHIGVHLVRVRPGDETTEHHRHRCEEEFIYVLSGRGVAAIGDQTFEVAGGDFMGFAAGAAAHSMSNPFEEDLVYLVGGERLDADVVDYPRVRKRIYKVAGERKLVDGDDLADVN